MSKFLKITVSFSWLISTLAFAFGAYVFWISGDMFASIAFGIGTVIFLIVFLSTLFGGAVSKKEQQRLRQSGQKILSEFKALDRRWNFEVNGQSPIIVYS